MSSDPSQTVVEAIHKLIDADNRRDIEAVLACYTNDVIWLPPDDTLIVGVQAIRDRYEKLFAAYRVDIQIQVAEIEVRDDLAYAWGSTSGRLIPEEGGAPLPVDDKYMMLLAKAPGRGWLVRRLMWNRGAET